MKRSICVGVVWMALVGTAFGQRAASFSKAVKDFVVLDAPVIALTHVRVMDGTGAPAMDDQTVIIQNGRIRSIGPAGQIAAPQEAVIKDFPGHTVIPGLVGMHDHLFYPAGQGHYNDLAISAPRLYLAGGVTTIRTTGSIEPYTDLNLKKLIDAGKMAGPDIYVTGPYLEGPGSFTPQTHELTGPDDARKLVEYWAGEGVTSFKAYMNITQAELKAAIEAAHARGIKVTGHLCSIGFREAALLGIDDLEHGLVVDTEFDPNKKPDFCPPQQETATTLEKLDIEGEPVQETIRDLVKHGVAVTSTLPVFETFVPNRPPLDARALAVMLPQTRIDYLSTRARLGAAPASSRSAGLRKEMQFERDFVKAGGLLLAGLDPTGYGGVVPGFGDQREVELLVEAGFSPAEAIHIASFNGAQFLGESNQIGSLAVGKKADLVVLHGDPSKSISDIEKVVWVFKDGIAYDSAKLIESARDSVGLH
ncbi:MAG: amidohydrolase family protein [Acidobacteriia bacterium]|nr:amidohydrolase family protein [Terriglobia bacterium]